MGKMAEMGRRDRTVLFVSHDLGAITQLCTRAVWLESGRVQADGPARAVVSSYLARVMPGKLLDSELDDEPNSAAAVKRVTVRDARTGQVLTTPERGQFLTIEIAVEAREAIPDLDIAFMLVDERGAIIVNDAVGDRRSRKGAELSGEPGTYVVSATIPPLLRAGTYTVRSWIGNGFEESMRDLLSIHIAPRPDDPQEFAERARVVQPDIEWKVRWEPIL